MTSKRKRRVSPFSKGLAPGERLKRNALLGNVSSRWSWVGTEVDRVSNITPEHVLISCGLSQRNNNPFCQDKFSLEGTATQLAKKTIAGSGDREPDDDIIIISEDERHPCSPKNCKCNPNCLNYLGQENWEDEDNALRSFMKAIAFENDPALNTRELDFPVGLKNLGATCYANAPLQVWFRDLAFRSGVYSCTPSDTRPRHKESPIFQLQVTFAALQESSQTCFNPVKLVESLKLRTTEQQDAQEFSKLFMSHLDAEFKTQANHRVKSLVTDQFQGEQIYGTLCKNCQYCSERVSNFLEIEISLKNHAKLEDRIKAMLEPETLSGDNQYLCPQCQCLQDATRYTELKRLPPVLHFSLLRFVYDLSTMERKKLKHSVSFPTTLDMTPFMEHRGNDTSGHSASNHNIYKLRGVLLHKGSSAHHGHYEALVFDKLNKSWFQFNDETVTQVRTLVQRSSHKTIVVDGDFDEKLQRQRTYARQRRQIESEDKSSNAVNEERSLEYITSKDAYMLIYAREVETSMEIPTPPSDAMEVINGLNAAHNDSCKIYNKRNEVMEARFKERRRRVMGIYRNWRPKPTDTDFILVSCQALSAWLSLCQGNFASFIASDDSQEKKQCKVVTLGDIMCVHGAVDPGKAGSIKRLSRVAYLDIVKDTGWYFEPQFTVSDICVKCVQRSFTERLYEIEHPGLVARFDRILEGTSDYTGFWISKSWVKDWRLDKPKMHVVDQEDPAPDSDDFAADVLCEHGSLSLSTTSRRRISAEAAGLLKNLYPSWNPLSTNTELCPVCYTNVHISMVDKRELRKQAKDEKAKLRNFYEQLLSEEDFVAENVSCAVVPIEFAEDWRKWLERPTDCLRPARIDNTCFICEHGMLVFDPNVPSEFESALLVHRSDWDMLESLYSAGPLITLTRATKQSGRSDMYTYSHNPLVCIDCRMRRKKEWASAYITIRLESMTNKGQENKGSKKSVVNSSSGARRSRRLRQIEDFEEKRRFTISKSTTVKDIKVMVQGEFNIPTICQQLLHHGKELNDNMATVESLEIYADDLLDLRWENEVIDLNSDSEVPRQPLVEGRGFHGTLLGSSRPVDQPTTLSRLDGSEEKSCNACTFPNKISALSCTICDTTFP